MRRAPTAWLECPIIGAWAGKPPNPPIKGKTMDTPTAKYGIPAAKRTSKMKPKTSISAGGTNATAMAAAKKVMTEHRTVIKALAKR